MEVMIADALTADIFGFVSPNISVTYVTMMPNPCNEFKNANEIAREYAFRARRLTAKYYFVINNSILNDCIHLLKSLKVTLESSWSFSVSSMGSFSSSVDLANFSPFLAAYKLNLSYHFRNGTWNGYLYEITLRFCTLMRCCGESGIRTNAIRKTTGNNKWTFAWSA